MSLPTKNSDTAHDRNIEQWKHCGDPGTPYLDSEMWASCESGSQVSALARSGEEARPYSFKAIPFQQTPTEPIQPNFNRIASPYRYLEYLTLGRILERCRDHFLPKLFDCQQALILGDGDGRFLAKLYTANPTLHATAVDISAAMLNLLRRRCEAAAFNAKILLLTCNSSALEHTPSSQTDLVVAHFFFDCLTQSDLDALIDRVAKHVRPNALWLISDFRIPGGPIRLPARLIIRALYLAFRILTGLRTTRLPDHATPLSRAGLIRIDHHHSMAGMLATELWQRPPAK